MQHFNLIDNISRISNNRISLIYHKSPYSLGKSFKYKDRRKLEGTHVNSGLGLWGLRDSRYARDSDFKTYTFNLKSNANIYGMAYHRFKNLTQNMSEEEVLKLRKKLIKIQVDVLCVLDEDSIAEIIVINDEVIENFVRIKNEKEKISNS